MEFVERDSKHSSSTSELQDRVCFRGFVTDEELIRLTGEGRVLHARNGRAGQSLATMEAMAAGLTSHCRGRDGAAAPRGTMATTGGFTRRATWTHSLPGSRVC